MYYKKRKQDFFSVDMLRGFGGFFFESFTAYYAEYDMLPDAYIAKGGRDPGLVFSQVFLLVVGADYLEV